MRVAAISDIHGNLPAFESVLDDLPAVDAMLCAGDVVGYNPWPRACIEIVRDRGISTVSGNHDRAVARATGFGFNPQAKAGVEYARDQLSDADLEWLASLPTSRRLHDDRVRVVHGHPDDSDRYTFPSAFVSDLLEEEDVLVMGHTHVQHVESFDAGIVLNPGSVGQPRDGDPRAAYAIIDLGEDEVTLHRVEYDVDRVRSAITEAGLPDALGERLTVGR